MLILSLERMQLCLLALVDQLTDAPQTMVCKPPRSGYLMAQPIAQMPA